MLEQMLVSSAPAAKPDFFAIPNTDFINATQLTTLVGLDAHAGKGLLMPDADSTPWLFIRDEGKAFMIPKRPLRYKITRAALTSNGLRDGKNVTINGAVWTVRLFKGANVATSEWNKYMYGVCDSPLNPPKRYALYTYAELGMTEVGSLGITSHVYEIISGGFYVRGTNGNIGYINDLLNTEVFNSTGWRPILEYVSGDIPW
jgi:hypothetical protein